jgi:photosystem II stability/assembly factor-like uncharacterized protein
VSADGDDLEVIELESAETASTPKKGRRPGRGPFRPLVIRPLVIVAGALALAAGSLAATALVHHSRDARAKTAETIVLPTATAAPSATVAPPTHAPIVDPDAEFVGRMGVIAPGAGWALNGLALYRTVDDTAHWSNITPPGVTDAIAHIYALDFLDPDHAWLAVALDNQPVTIDRTSDGGRSWEAIRPNACGAISTPDGLPCGFPVAIDFVDHTHGWAVFSRSDTTGTLLATDDGGTTWTVAGPTPFVGAVHFADASTGWGTGARGALYRTTDGAKTWRSVAVPAGASGTTLSPVDAVQFFGRDGVVLARLTSRPAQPSTLAVYESSDGGASWTTTAAPLDPGANVVNLVEYRFSAAGPRDWALLFGAHVSLTHDAGRHWSTLTPTSGLLNEIRLTSASSAWLLAPPPTCKSPADGCDNTVLLHTNDGGQTWHSGSPTIGITAARLP